MTVNRNEQMEPALVLNPIRAELERLQLHSVNLSVEALDDQFVALHGSLLAYWKKLPDRLSGPWLLEQLRALPDAAGPVAVMEALLATFQPLSPSRTQLTLFDCPAATPAAPKNADERTSKDAKLS
jgi:hypothetical protein